MSNVLILGSGPAAAAVALALSRCERHTIHVLDIGGSLEERRAWLLEEVSGLQPGDWPEHAARELTARPVAEVHGELPQKRVFGSNFPFRDLGQLQGVSVVEGGNRFIVSGAYGGFSNVWGSQVLPFTRETIAQWPIAYDDLSPHYAEILRHIPFAAHDDDYSALFPLFAPVAPLPRLAAGAEAAIARYEARREAVQRRGVTVGRARLALDAARCIECGLCLTGCPYGLIYSASQTFDDLIKKQLVDYTSGMLVRSVGENEDGCWVAARDLTNGEVRRFTAEHVFVACGGLGSTRIALNSARPDARNFTMAESAQFVLPFVSTRAHPDPREYSTFTLNQLSMLVEYGRAGLDLAHLHLYPYNPAFDERLPAIVRALEPTRRGILRRATAALGYLPSWVSPSIAAEVTSNGTGDLPNVRLSAKQNPMTNPVLRRVMRQLLTVARTLDLWPVIPALRLSGPGKSYHFGGSFPHVSGRPRCGAFETDTLGRLAEWRRIHLVDGAVLPTVPATTFTLSVMANAHRIASAAAEEM
jgi:choline dehydrogenase-like flavoprotein